jgi:branched-chain amino acid transport system substrate-binding protein
MNTTTQWIIGIIVVAVIAIIALTGQQKGPEETGPIKIGLSAPMSGEAASYGEAAAGAAQLAVMEINESGGINGRTVELIIEDDMCTSDSVSAINKLSNIDQVTAIVGPICSSAAGPGVPIAQEAGIPTLMIASAPNLTETGDYIFRIYPSDAFQGKFVAEYVYNEMEKRSAAVLYVKNDWGQGIKETFIEQFKSLGGEIVYEEGVLQSSTDMRTQLAELKVLNPEVLYFPVYPQNGVAGLKQLKEMGINIPIVGGDAFEAEEILSINESEGVLYAVAKVNNPDNLQEDVKEKTGNITNVITPYVYDAVKMLAHVIEEVGTDRKEIRNALDKISYSAVSAPVIEFDQDGEVKTAEFTIKVIKDGEAIEL